MCLSQCSFNPGVGIMLSVARGQEGHCFSWEQTSLPDSFASCSCVTNWSVVLHFQSVFTHYVQSTALHNKYVVKNGIELGHARNCVNVYFNK